MKIILSIVVLILGMNFLGESISSHEGHNDTLMKSTHGGTVKRTTDYYIELVQEKALQVFIMDHDYKNALNSVGNIQFFVESKGKSLPLKYESSKDSLTIRDGFQSFAHFKLKMVIPKSKITANKKAQSQKEEIVYFPLENE